jgi:hypothetical protein
MEAEMTELYTMHVVPMSVKTEEVLRAARRRQPLYVISV